MGSVVNMPSTAALWLNWRIARYGKTEQAREHATAMLGWIFCYNPDPQIKHIASVMLKRVTKGNENGGNAVDK